MPGEIEIFRGASITGWRRNQRLAGRPDFVFVFRKQRVAVFVDGCFWHDCAHGKQPASNTDFWDKKLGFARPDPKEPWQLPTTDPACIAVREELKSVMKFWLDLGANGFRVDMAYSPIQGKGGCGAIESVFVDCR